MNAYRSMEDRSNDWLAKELREEKRALSRLSEMFEQQMEHKTHCDARILKEYHLNNCDAGGVDTGVLR